MMQRHGIFGKRGRCGGMAANDQGKDGQGQWGLSGHIG